MMIEQFKVSGSHHEIGLAIGERFATQIRRLLDSYKFFQDTLLTYHRSPEGQSRYESFLEINRTRYPDYVTELEGLAEGAGVRFEHLFLLNLRGEYRDYLHELEPRGCSDCVLVTDEAALFGHNEDGSPAFRNNMYLVHGQVEDKPAFTALAYPGFLPGNAFGFNAEGICFSIDNVRPMNVRVGVGRHFIARSLLEAQSLDDAIERATVPDRASGFSYTIGSAPERRIVVVEVTPHTHDVREIRGAYYHANHYLELADVDQVVDPSSRARVDRAKATLQENPPQDAAGVLALLGDQADEEYPIYRTAEPPDDSITHYTALFDLGAGRLRIYTHHPTQTPNAFVEFAMQERKS